MSADLFDLTETVRTLVSSGVVVAACGGSSVCVGGVGGGYLCPRPPRVPRVGSCPAHPRRHLEPLHPHVSHVSSRVRHAPAATSSSYTLQVSHVSSRVRHTPADTMPCEASTRCPLPHWWTRAPPVSTPLAAWFQVSRRHVSSRVSGCRPDTWRHVVHQEIYPF